LTYIYSRPAKEQSVLDKVDVQMLQQQATPAPAAVETSDSKSQQIPK
jgi:hypothetical protein